MDSRDTMDKGIWNEIEGNWKQIKGKVKEKWNKLTDDDLEAVAGRRDHLEGVLQERYGESQQEVARWVNDWERDYRR